MSHFLTLNLYLLSISQFQLCTGDTINCNGDQSCQDKTMTCQSNEKCMINCNGSNGGSACKGALIDASSATDVILHCVHQQDCQDTQLICGTGDCEITCFQNNDQEQCKFKSVQCGFGDCIINCKGEYSCVDYDSDFIIASSASFECIGYCPSSFPSSSVVETPISTTAIPTIIPTLFPTIIPTTNPSTFPSVTSISDAIYDTVVPTTVTIAITAMGNISAHSNDNDYDNKSLILLFILLLMIFICLSMIVVRCFVKRKKLRKQKTLPPGQMHGMSGRTSAESISEHISLKNDTDFVDGCTAIDIAIEGEIDAHSEGDAYKGENDLVHLQTSNNSFNDRECIDIGLNENEFIVTGHSDDDNATDGKQTEGR